MPVKHWQIRVEHMLENINAIISFTTNLDFDSFSADRKTIYAVLTAFNIIGEAARCIPPQVRTKYPEVPWSQMIRMRNVLIHEYHRVDLQIVWDTIQGDLPVLSAMLQKLVGRDS